MYSIEQEIKQQFVRLFTTADAPLFRGMAEYYLQRAAFLKMADIDIDPRWKLLARNCQKRLFIGMGVELLLKAIYLQRGYSINSLKADQAGAPAFPFTFQQVAGFKQATDRTYMLNDLVEKLARIVALQNMPVVTRGLKIAKVFRNKEGHVVVSAHTFDPSNYRDIERSLVALYAGVFQQVLEVQFSIGEDERAVWKIR